MELSEAAKTILRKRYLLRDEFGNVVETPEGLFRRVANAVSYGLHPRHDLDCIPQERIALADEYYNAMSALEFLPNSPCLAGAGRNPQQLSACYVCPIDDSLASIFKTLSDAALISQGGGGVGFSFGHIRPKNDIVRSSTGVASGPVSFMKVYDAATDCIKQGSFRRGACMGVLPVTHPDIEEFIAVKKTSGVLTNFNLSVGITDAFMEAVKDDKPWALVNPRTRAVHRTVRARDLWNLIVESAWDSGEPGVIFLDTVNASNPLPGLGMVESPNPCGEQPLLPYQACVLGSINLAKMPIIGDMGVDLAYLDRIVRMGVRFLNDVIDASDYPIPEITEMTRATRPIGLGIMGWADLLIMLGIPYDSSEALELARGIMSRITQTAWDESRALAERDGAFPALGKSVFKDDPRPPRNSTVTTVAPTGTLSMIADCSSGIEPIFAVAYTKTVMDGMPFVYVNKYFRRMMEQRGLWSEDLAQRVAETGSAQGIDIVPDDMKRLFRTAHEIEPNWHILMQAAFQNHVTSAISKTINLSHDATVDDVAQAYELGWNVGCKGLTCFRDGCRDAQVITVGAPLSGPSPELPDGCLSAQPLTAEAVPKNRPPITFGYTERIQTGCGHMYLTLNHDEEGVPCETFAYCSNGGCQGLTEGVSRLISLALRAGVPVEYIVDRLTDVKCPVAVKRQAEIKNKSCPDAMGKALEVFAEYCEQEQVIDIQINGATKQQATEVSAPIVSPPRVDGLCPECGDVMTKESGCCTCYNCGYSRCG